MDGDCSRTRRRHVPLAGRRHAEDATVSQDHCVHVRAQHRGQPARCASPRVPSGPRRLVGPTPALFERDGGIVGNHANAACGPRPAHQPAPLLVAAAYYETLGLVGLGTHGCNPRVVADDASFAAASLAQPPDVAFVEPIVYDPRLRPFDVHTAARRLAAQQAPPVFVIDSTLVGPSIPISRILDEARALPLVVQASSGLKLDQAGLELANVGIVSLYAPASRGAELAAAEGRLRLIRRLNGTALTVDTVALLDIPFFLDPATFYEHCTAVFAHNARLARAVPAGGVFEAIAHPALDPRNLPWAQAPFVFFHLRDDVAARYVELESLVIEEAEARGLALERGGSFGFRGHRCESIALDGAERNGIFKVALGARSGPSVDGLVALLVDIAAFPTIAAARDALLGARVSRPPA